MSVKISVIVPVYNVEKYLETCIESILNQSLSEIQLILIDDGSTDRSLQICKEFGNKDSRVTVITENNQGPSAARNRGLAAAKGEYVGFVDSDDWIEPEMFSRLYQKASAKALDLVYCDYIRETSGKSDRVSTAEGEFDYNADEIKSRMLPYFFGYSDQELPRHHSYSPFSDDQSYIWLAIYKRNLLTERKILFPDVKKYLNEDNLFNLLFLTHAKSLSHICGFYYHYRDEENSYTSAFKPDFLEMKLNKYRYLESYISLLGFPDSFAERLKNKKLLELKTVLNYYAGSLFIGKKERIAWLKKIVGLPVYRELLSASSISKIPSAGLKVLLLLAKLKAVYLILLICILNRRLHK